MKSVLSNPVKEISLRIKRFVNNYKTLVKLCKSSRDYERLLDICKRVRLQNLTIRKALFDLKDLVKDEELTLSKKKLAALKKAYHFLKKLDDKHLKKLCKRLSERV